MKKLLIFLFLISCTSTFRFNGHTYFKEIVPKKSYKNHVRIHKITSQNRIYKKSSSFNKNVEKIHKKHYKNMFR